MREIVQIEIVRPEVIEGIDTDDHVEELPGEGQQASVGVNGEYQVAHAGIFHADEILVGAGPEVDRPDFDPELAG